MININRLFISTMEKTNTRLKVTNFHCMQIHRSILLVTFTSIILSVTVSNGCLHNLLFNSGVFLIDSQIEFPSKFAFAVNY